MYDLRRRSPKVTGRSGGKGSVVGLPLLRYLLSRFITTWAIAISILMTILGLRTTRAHAGAGQRSEGFPGGRAQQPVVASWNNRPESHHTAQWYM